jgi:integrase
MARIAKPWFYRQTGWWMVWLNGTKHKLAKGKANRREADKRLLELRLQLCTNVDADSPHQTVASVIDTYQGFAEKQLAVSTNAIRLSYLQSFAELHGWRQIPDCKPHHIQGWLDSHPEWKSDWTKNSALRNVQVAFNWAWKTRLIDENPFRGVTHRAGSPRRNITRDEFQAILRAVYGKGRRRKPTPAARFRQILVFLWFTGCRPKEASILKWTDVDFQNKLIVLTEHKTIRTQTKPRPRIIPLHPVAERLLLSIKARDEGDLVFLTHRRTPWNRHNLGHRIRRARAKAGIPDEVKLYGVRHAFGTRAILNGVDLKTLSTLMGHTTTRMSEHYVHLAGEREHLAAAMRRANVRHPGA